MSSFFDTRRHSLLHFIVLGEMSPLEIPLEVRKGMEIVWRQIRTVGRMGENFKLQRLQSINLWASGLRSCSNTICDVDRLTRHTLCQCTELNWQFSQLPKILSCKLFVSPQKTVKRIMPADGAFLNFFGACLISQKKRIWFVYWPLSFHS
jgi:hypothetical protein